MNKPVKVTLFDNGNVAVWDKDSQQVTSLQGAFFDYKYLNKLAKAIADNNLEIEDLGSPACDFYERVKHFKRVAAPPQPENRSGMNNISFLFPLSDGTMATLYMPAAVSITDVKRLKRMLNALYINGKSTAQPEKGNT